MPRDEPPSTSAAGRSGIRDRKARRYSVPVADSAAVDMRKTLAPRQDRLRATRAPVVARDQAESSGPERRRGAGLTPAETAQVQRIRPEQRGGRDLKLRR